VWAKGFWFKYHQNKKTSFLMVFLPYYLFIPDKRTNFAAELDNVITFIILAAIESIMNALNNANTKDPIICRGLASFAFPEAISSRTGVSVRYVPSPDKKWYVLRILYGHAQQVADMMIESGDYGYLAMVWKDEWHDGKKRRVLRPFMNILFAFVTDERAEYYVKQSSGARFTTYYYNHFKTDSNGYNPPLTVPSRAMEPLIRTTAIRDEHVMEVDIKKCRFVSDDLVRVTQGPFEGVEGRVARVARQNRVIVYIEGLQAGLTTAYIPPYSLEIINNANI
jgi:hypothetical protein